MNNKMYDFLSADEMADCLQILQEAEEYRENFERKHNMKIILYHQESCGQCKMAEMLLKKENIPYESCTNIDEMKEKGITQTPVLSVNDKLYYGAKSIKEWIESRK